MNIQIMGALLLTGLMGGAPAQAQQMPAAAPSPAPLSAGVPSYKIAAGDVLSVGVVDFPNLSTPQAVVTPDGSVSLPLIGQVMLAGRTVDQATSLLSTKWRKYIVRPAVTVSLVQKHPQTVVFSGSVNHPGVLDYRPGMHLLEALAEVGGLVTAGSPTTGSATTVGLQTTISDPAHVTVTHEDGTSQALNLTHPETLAGSPVDIALEPGDVVYVPQQLGKISVVGEVKQPGVIPFREDLTVFDAVSDSGGYNLETADLPDATLTHNGKVSPINLDPMLRHGDMSANIVLAPGDQIAIPELKNRTFVMGDVARPGFFLFKPGDRILDALSGVYGPTPQADLGKINVIHSDKAHNTVQMVRVNLNDFLLHGHMSGNPLIQPGDSLYIPDKKHSLSVQDVFSALTGVGQVAYGASVLGAR